MKIDIRKPLKSLLPHLQKAAEDNLNEADTRQRISRMLEQVLGYDPMTEITRETQIRAKYVDIAIRIDGSIKLLIEAKSAGTRLRDRHIEQAQHYAAEGNIPWVVLTNGIVWNLYHLSFEEGIDYTRAFSVDLSEDDLDRSAELLAVLHRRSVTKGGLEEYWEQKVALSPSSIGRSLFMEGVLKLVRREIRRHEGIMIDEEDLANALHNMLSTEAREEIGPMKIGRTPKRRRRIYAAKIEASASTKTVSPSASSAKPAKVSVSPATPGEDN